MPHASSLEVREPELDMDRHEQSQPSKLSRAFERLRHQLLDGDHFETPRRSVDRVTQEFPQRD
jgi:hypothetical protein